MIPVAAEKVFSLGLWPVTNSVLTGSFVAGLFVCLGLALRRPAAAAPRGLQNWVEAGLEAMLGFMDQVTHDRVRSRRFLPLVGTAFLFILASNWFGLLPGVGTFGLYANLHGALELIPLFRPATSDLNMTLALGATAVIVSHLVGIMTLGFLRHWNKFIQLGGLWTALRAFGRLPLGAAVSGLFTAVIGCGVGLIELVSEAAKVVSLSLRLFGNIFAGEVLIHVLSSLLAYVMPTPFLFLELIVGLVQALVFSMLTLVYLTLAAEPPHDQEETGRRAVHA